MLDDENINSSDRLRLITLYLLYRNGLLPADTQKLLAHAQLPPQDGEVIHNLDFLGARVQKPLKDTKSTATPLFPKKQAPSTVSEEYALSRFDPAVRSMLEDHIRGTLDQAVFPFRRPHLDAPDGLAGQGTVSQASLRSAKPTWAKSKLSSVEPRQRIIVFIAGGATYAESRACYEVSRATSRDIFLATSHMVTPTLFLRQVGDLSVDKRKLDIPAERPKPKAPAHLFERDEPPKPPATSQKPAVPSKSPVPPTAEMQAMNVKPNDSDGKQRTNGAAVPPTSSPGSGKLKKEKDKDPGKKKKHHFFSSKK